MGYISGFVWRESETDQLVVYLGVLVHLHLSVDLARHHVAELAAHVGVHLAHALLLQTVQDLGHTTQPEDTSALSSSVGRFPSRVTCPSSRGESLDCLAI